VPKKKKSNCILNREDGLYLKSYWNGKSSNLISKTLSTNCSCLLSLVIFSIFIKQRTFLPWLSVPLNTSIN
jgi:hypothetical protein